jgi:phage-related protein
MEGTMTEGPGWTVIFYKDGRGRDPVKEFILALAEDEQAALVGVIDLLQELGVSLRFPHSRPVDQGLWELRGGAGRIFYFAHTGRRFVLLHAYRKHSQKAPRREIETALRRWADYLERER